MNMTWRTAAAALTMQDLDKYSQWGKIVRYRIEKAY